MPVSESISKKVLCLPLYAGITHEVIADILNTLN
jgi:dTDP-4-amino-4,6-dideoxygalactose transaminase